MIKILQLLCYKLFYDKNTMFERKKNNKKETFIKSGPQAFIKSGPIPKSTVWAKDLFLRNSRVLVSNMTIVFLNCCLKIPK